MEFRFFKNKKTLSKLSYKKKEHFFSVTEKDFFGVLKDVASDLNMELFAKVRWADILYCNNRGNRWWSGWAKIKSKHVDFLLCDKESLSPKIVIELDDSSHLEKRRVARDNFQTEILEQVGIGLIRIRPQNNYSKDEIKKSIIRLIE